LIRLPRSDAGMLFGKNSFPIGCLEWLSGGINEKKWFRPLIGTVSRSSRLKPQL